MRNALRNIFALCLALLIAQFAVARPVLRDPVVAIPAKPFQEAALHTPPSQNAPPPMVATGLPVPRWVTVKAQRLNVRRGPSLERDVLWTYVRPGMPIEVIAEYDTWRRIRDIDCATGWVKASMLDGRRSVIVTGRVNTALLNAPKADSDAVAFAAPGLVAKLVGCSGEWCEISTRGYDGYVVRDRLWGVYAGETVK